MKEWQINELAYDETTKDHVLVINRKPNPDELEKWLPFEGMAWRVLGWKGNRAIVGLKYVNIEGHKLSQPGIDPVVWLRQAQARRTTYNRGMP
jgi:hypothetical protein